VQRSSQIVTTNKPTPSFLHAECPACCPTNSVKVLMAKSITLHGLAHHKLSWVLPTFGAGLPSLVSPLMPVPPKKDTQNRNIKLLPPFPLHFNFRAL